MSSTYKRHPLSALLPAMGTEVFDQLVEDIAKHGIRQPIILYQGQILDGWHRFQAGCKAAHDGAKVEFHFEPFHGDAAALVLSSILHRDLTKSQRALAVAELGNWAGPGRPEKGAAAAPLATVADQATKAGVGERTMQNAKRVAETGSVALKEAVKEGLSVEKAAPIASLPKSEQRAAIKEARGPKPRADKPDTGMEASELDDLKDRLFETNSLLRAEEAKCAALEDENGQLKKIINADDRLAEMEKRVVRYQEQSRIADARVTGLQNERNNAIRLSNSWKTKAEKAAKASA